MGLHEKMYGGKLNGTTNAKVTIDAEVDAIDDGNMYMWNHYITSTAMTTTGQYTIHMRTAATTTLGLVYLNTVNIYSSGPFEWYLYEGCTISTAGTTAPALNLNRTSTNTHTAMQLAGDATLSAAGTTLYHGYITGQTGLGFNLETDALSRKWILTKDESYALRIIPGVTNTAATVDFIWGEKY